MTGRVQEQDHSELKSLRHTIIRGGRELAASIRENWRVVCELASEDEGLFADLAREARDFIREDGLRSAGRCGRATLEAVEDRFQLFVQERIDPLLGNKRSEQLREILGDASLSLSREERLANSRIGLGLLALAAAIMARSFFPPLVVISIIIGLLSMWATFHLAWQQWKTRKRLGALHLICIYIAFLWLGGYALIGSIGVLLMGIGLKIKTLSENQSRNNLINIFQLQPASVWVRQSGEESEIPFKDLRIGNTLVLRAGQSVPVDGVISHGAATVDQHMLTGESQPAEKTVGDAVLAATVVISGSIDVCVEKTGADTTAGRIGVVLNETAQLNTRMSMKVIEMVDRLALPTLILSAIAYLFLGAAGAISLMGANFTIITYITGPLAVLNFLNIAAENSILVKDGGALEQLNRVTDIVFDKTGTLTLDQPEMANLHHCNSVGDDRLLQVAAAAEARQPHPIARAILTAAEARGLAPLAVDEAHYEVGYGIKVRLAGLSNPVNDSVAGTATVDEELRPVVRVGSMRYMAMEGIRVPGDIADLAAVCQTDGHSVVMVAIGDELAGGIELRPTVRPEAAGIAKGLRRLGMETYIISGDQEGPTRKLALDLGMTGYFANTLPERKAHLVEELQQRDGLVCFIGDGINDAIAMRKANVSVSLRGATNVATDSAQIILMQGNLEPLLNLLGLARDMEANLRNNLRFTATLSLLTAAGILFLGFTFIATEVLYTVSLLGGVGIAMSPVLKRQGRISQWFS